jgi:hypothetical protein
MDIQETVTDDGGGHGNLNGGAKLLNGNMAIYLRIASLAFQGLIVAGVFWVGATFERKSDFEAYKAEQEKARADEYKVIAQTSETMARLDERLKAFMEHERNK